MSSTGQILGGVVGGLIGAVTPVGPFVGAQIGLTLGALLDPPKGPTISGPRIADLSVQTSAYGTSIPRIYGICIVTGNVFWIENNRLKETVTKKKSGGKGGPKTTTKTYSYSATFAVGLCEGPIVGVLRIWVGPNLIYHAGSTDQQTIIASNEAAEGFRLYLGDEEQLPDPRMQAALGVDNTPAFRGLAYIVFDDFQLEKYGNTMSGAQVKVEVMRSGSLYTYVDTQHNMPSSHQYAVTAYGNGFFVRLAHFSTSAWTSPDAEVAWTEHSGVFTGGPFWKGIAFGNGWFVATTYETGFPIWRTKDGEHWFDTYYTPDPGNAFSGEIAFGNGIFVIVTDNGYVLRSVNEGETWTKHDLPYNNIYAHILHNGLVFLVWQAGAGKCMTSPDGVTWTGGAIGGAPLFQHNLGATKGLTFMLFSNTGSGYAAKTSDDGLTWVDVGIPPYSKAISSDTWNWVCLGNTGFAVSEDGNAWTDYPYTITSAQPWEAPAWNGAIIAIASSNGAEAYIIQPKLSAGSDTTLGAIIAEECPKSGVLTSGDILTSALTQPVHGYRVSTRGTIRSAIEPLQAAWPFDVIQHGYKIKFIPRDGATVATIDAADLGAHPAGESAPVQVILSRQMDTQLPRRVAIQYLDVDRDQERNEQYAERTNNPATNIVALELAISLTASEAAAISEKLLYLAWLERYRLQFSLPATYGHLEPADVVDLPTSEGTAIVRLTAIEYTSDGRLECKASYDQAAIYEPAPDTVADTGGTAPPVTITPVGPSIYHLLDLPMMSDAQSGYGFLAAMCGANSGWYGGVLMQSIDDGSTWSEIQDFSPPGAAIGYATTTLGAVNPGLIDSGSVLGVILHTGALYDCTEAFLFAGENHFAYGADGRWEIIAAKRCTLQTGKTYVLTDLLRGRFGTEWAMSLHQGGDAIILLDPDDLAVIAMSEGSIGLDRLYRGVTIGRDISSDYNRTFAYQAVNLKPLSPVFLNGNRDASGNWTLEWVRRTRGVAEWRDGFDAPLNEQTEQYQIDVFSSSGYSTVNRSISVSAATATYSSASQVADFGSNQTTLYIKIYQMSAVVGRGYPLTQSITR